MSHVGTTALHWITALDESLALGVGPSGASIASFGGINITLSGGGKTVLGRGTIPAPGVCHPHGAAIVTHAAAANQQQSAAAVTQQWHCIVPPTETAVEVTVVDLFAPARASISISTTISTSAAQQAPFFTAALSVALHTGSLSSVWLPWNKGCVQNNGKGYGMCDSAAGPWRDPFTPERLAHGYYRYGTSGHGTNDSFALPLVTLLDAKRDVGLSLALSPADSILELTLNTSTTGALFTRELLRLGGGNNKSVSFAAHIYSHAGCWRPALGFLTEEWPTFFEPWVSERQITSYEGLGSYSWNQMPLNVSRALSLGWRTNWDLSGTWMPYDGLFLPYQEEWLNLGPINGGLAQYNVTFDQIAAYYSRIQRAGFHSLSYFDIGNWGTRSDLKYNGTNLTCGIRPNGLGAPCPNPDGANSYLKNYLSDGLLQNGWDVLSGKWKAPKINDWVGTSDMDTLHPIFEDLIVEQLQRHVEKLPDTFEGIAIDRLDYSEFFNYDADDGVSWIPRNKSTNEEESAGNDLDVWGPARALRISYRHTFQRLHEILHPSAVKAAKAKAAKAAKTTTKTNDDDREDSRDGEGDRDSDRVMFNNCNTLCRLDEMEAFDGTFSEGSSLNAAAWVGLRAPTILWTYSLLPDLAALDPYFQQHLLMNAYPMAPMPLNDHSILPSPDEADSVVEQAYRDYAPLFTKMHGARWVLTAHPVALSSNGAAASANMLYFYGGTGTASAYLVPVMLGGKGKGNDTVMLTMRPPDGSTASGFTLSAMYPGGGERAVVLPPPRPGEVEGSWFATVPLKRGCALLQLTANVTA